MVCSMFSVVTFSSPFKQVTAFVFIQCKPQEQEWLDLLLLCFPYSNICLLVEWLAQLIVSRVIKENEPIRNLKSRIVANIILCTTYNLMFFEYLFFYLLLDLKCISWQIIFGLFFPQLFAFITLNCFLHKFVDS